MSKIIKMRTIDRHAKRERLRRSQASLRDAEISYEYDMWDDETVELKKWKLEEVLDLKPMYGITPKYDLDAEGFVFEEEIDVKELFGDYAEKDSQDSRVRIVSNTRDGSQSRPWTPAKEDRDWRLVKDKLEKILDNLDYKNRELIIYRTFKGGNINWDKIGVFSKKVEAGDVV